MQIFSDIEPDKSKIATNIVNPLVLLGKLLCRIDNNKKNIFIIYL